MRILTKYVRDFDSIATARNFLAASRRVRDIPITFGSSRWTFHGDLLEVKTAARGAWESLRLSEPFLEAFCQFIKPRIPLRFASEISPLLFAEVANTLMHADANRAKALVLRMEEWDGPDGTLKRALALVTPTYRFVDHDAVLAVVQEAMPRAAAKVSIDDDMLLIEPTASRFAITLGGAGLDHYRFGLRVVNSETRQRKLCADFHLVREICSNGATTHVWGRRLAIRHVVDPREALTRLRVVTGQIDWTAAEASLRLQLQALTRGGLLPERADRLRVNVERLAGRKRVRAEWPNRLEIISRTPGAAPTMYDYFVATTAIAKGLDLHRRLELEALAGRVFLREGSWDS